MPEVYHTVSSSVVCCAFNSDRSQLALCPNNEEVHIYVKKGASWSLSKVLKEHTEIINGIDWASESDKIVTCSSDRNAYVWKREGNDWKPTLVLLRMNRAATCVKWSPDENKFAVGCGAKLVSICYFEKENDWWVSKHIKKQINSTVLSVDWHPNNILLATGSCDFKCRIFSAYIKEIESKPSPTSWGSKMNFGACMHEFSNSGGGWVHSVSFSFDGKKVAWVGHDSSISVVDSERDNILLTVKSTYLPFASCTWISSNSIVSVGHDCVPYLFSIDGAGNLTFRDALDKKEKKQSENVFSALNKFRDLDRLGSTKSDRSNTSLNSIHQNAIKGVAIARGTKKDCAVFSTFGMDGKIIDWDLKSLEQSIAGLKIA
ncbi:uncharacterized protein TRIADDRAFT_60814 [Trichoplax adhaerens]|uniref:Actin-related protein 2/3 complex subunit n=1 Tax=Trichoplax adhaerens TaxID=10228 RepID=B3S988_TRIAD|nr:hypothetical protein TRIADDRAFT_60814 [Trichoplax adhaerens]EDV20660.1 hypothetical protein TRIADDRAFT_60814 [Trichoplax adhaerens]|eukprot:XP_002116860.1 hypothetical protein TRIADDRAFT_60814 [Trichoplax adhaerens]